MNEIQIPKCGVIVRTRAQINKNEIEKDFQNTLKTWEEIKNKAIDSNAPSLVYEEGDIIKRTLRDTYDDYTKTYISRVMKLSKSKKFRKSLCLKMLKILKNTEVKNYYFKMQILKKS